MFDLGIFGGGQLGRMLASAALPLGIRCCFWDPMGAEAPAAALGPVFTEIEPFVCAAERYTYEFENIEPALVHAAAKLKPVAPSISALEITRHRIQEKNTFEQLGIPTAPWRAVHTQQELEETVTILGLPLVLKTVTSGYDGKGQFVLRNKTDIPLAWNTLGAKQPLIAEQWINFNRELSLIAVRDIKGNCAFYPLVENTHYQGILSYTHAPAPDLDSHLQNQAQVYMNALLAYMDYVGVLTLEMFDTGGHLRANEMAPRVHNSGHWSIEGAHCSQFENHIRAVMNLPLGSTQCRGTSLMVNLVGALPKDKSSVLALRHAHMHLYNKEARPGRKLGHITFQSEHARDFEEEALTLKSLLPNPMAFNPGH